MLDVLSKLAEFERVGADLSHRDAQMKLTDLIDAMRSDVGLRSNRIDIELVLLGGASRDNPVARKSS